MSKSTSTLDDLKILPMIKPTLVLNDGGFDYWNEKVWILTDKITNKLYYIGRLEFEIISRWQAIPVQQLVDKVNAETLLDIKANDVEIILRFLLMNNLLQVSSEVINKVKDANQNSLQTIVQSLGKLFSLRMPLFNPDNFLTKTQNLVKPVFSNNFLYFILLLFFLNLYLLASNWGSFTNSIPSFSTFTNLVLIIFTMFFTKIIHELGHAYACKLSGCKVPEMGVIFIFFYPLLYTDVSSSIVLKPEKRLVISTAGIRFELYLAILAGVLWFFVPDDYLIKNLLFFIAAVSWVLSVAINIVPFMRFDGYYILSDYLHIRNLGIRSSAVFKYYVRSKIFGMQAALPESYHDKKYRFFLIFALLVGLYKIFLFTSILLFLYYTKILGLPLFIVGLFLFILAPMTKELYNIWQLRSTMQNSKNIKIAAVLSLIFLIVLMIPTRKNIYMPAVLLAKTERIYLPFAAQLESVNVKLNQNVKRDAKLVVLSNAKLTTDTIINQVKLATEKHYSAGVMLSDETRQKKSSEQSSIAYHETVEDNLALMNQRLEIKSPFDGKVTAIKEQLYNGIWLGKSSWVLDVTDSETNYLQAFVTAEDINNLDLQKNNMGVFIPNKFDFATCDVIFKTVAKQPITEISMQPFLPLSLAKSTIVNSNLLYFASEYGGNINLVPDEQKWVPVESFFALDFAPIAKCNNSNLQVIKGVIKMQGKNQSLINRAFNSVRGLFQRVS